MELFHMKRYVDEEESVVEENESPRVVKKRRKIQPTTTKDDTVEQLPKENPPVQKEEEQHEKEPSSEKKKEENGPGKDFMILGADSVLKQSKKKAKRVLPRWLAEPHTISDDLKDEQMPVEDVSGISESLISKLKKNGVTYLFPVQRGVVPHLLDSQLRNYYRPSDLCVCAPTGSGKTLSFVLPIVQALMGRVVPRVRALVILPVQDLAHQIYKVFCAYAEGLRVVLLASGQGKNVKAEQGELVARGLSRDGEDYHSLADIVVATPGRLVEHLQNTPGFNLSHLRYLIIDEADKVMDDAANDWLSQVEAAVYSGRKRPGPLTVRNANMRLLPLQKLLFSATLSQNPEKLQELNLYEPKLFCSTVKPKDIITEGTRNKGSLETFTTPLDLIERFVRVEDLMSKPLVLKTLLETEGIRSALIFVRSVANAHSLSVLMRQYGLGVEEMSSNVQKGRKMVLNRFRQKKVDFLICTDALARGIDIGTVDNVISYDVPRFIKTYVHRVGRTARAGRPGTAYTLVHEETEMESFKALLAEADKDTDSVVAEVLLKEEDLNKESYATAREKASVLLSDEKLKKKRKRGRN